VAKAKKFNSADIYQSFVYAGADRQTYDV